MKKLFRQSLVLTALAVMVSFSTNNATAQDADRNEQRRQDQLKRYRELMDIKSDADWRDKIEPLVIKVQEAQRVAGSTRGFAGFGGFGGGGRGGGAGGGRGGNGGGNADQGANRNRAGQASPEFEALQKAVTDKEPVEDVKEKLAKYRELRKTRDAAVEKAQDELRKALSPRQEAGAVVAGLLK